MKTRAEKLIDKMLKEYPYCVVNVETASEFIEQGGQVSVKQFRDWLMTNGYWRTYFNN